MTARTTIQSMSGATLSISATLPATYDSAGYTATTMVFTLVGQIENFGNHGATASVTNFTAVADAVVQKLKGSIDYGKKSLVLGNVPADVGQTLIDTAVGSTAHYSVKIQYPAGAGESTGEAHYLDVLVTKREWQDGAVNDVRKCAVDLDVCKKPVVVAAT